MPQVTIGQSEWERNGECGYKNALRCTMCLGWALTMPAVGSTDAASKASKYSQSTSWNWNRDNDRRVYDYYKTPPYWIAP